MLYPGEKIIQTGDYPSIVKYESGSKDKPLVIFVPGNSHLARIAYGYPGSNKDDFLSFWFHRYGYPFLAVSYPLGNPVYKEHYPNYTVTDWAKSIIDVAEKMIRKHSLSNRIIIVAWSMGGEVVQRINEYAMQKGSKIELFIGLSPAVPVYTLLPKGAFFDSLKPTKFGLANTLEFADFFQNMLSYQNKLNNHTIIPQEIYRSQFIGNCPIDIMGTALRYKDGRFIYSLSAAIHDAGALDINSYPPVAVIHGSSGLDLDYTLFSKFDWGSVIGRYYFNKLNASEKSDAKKYKQMLKLIKKAPGQLIMQVKGTHFFFVGKYGAKRTVDDVVKLLARQSKLNKRFVKSGG